MEINDSLVCQYLHCNRDELDEIKSLIKNRCNSEVVKEVMSKWNESKIYVHRKVNQKIKYNITSLIKEGYSPTEIGQAIENYSKIVTNPEVYWFTYKWTLWDFLKKGFYKFKDWNMADTNYKRKQTKVMETTYKQFDPKDFKTKIG